ncbi:transposase-like protein [Endozoicomonas sp. NE41]
MSVDIDPELVEKLASQIKTQDDLAELSRQLLKVSVERVMAAELEDHLGYSKHAPEGQNSGKQSQRLFQKNTQGRLR